MKLTLQIQLIVPGSQPSLAFVLFSRTYMKTSAESPYLRCQPWRWSFFEKKSFLFANNTPGYKVSGHSCGIDIWRWIADRGSFPSHISYEASTCTSLQFQLKLLLKLEEQRRHSKLRLFSLIYVVNKISSFSAIL